MAQETQKLKWNNSYTYYILLAATLGALILNDDPMELPMWGTALGVLFLGFMAADQSWKAYKWQGRAAVLVSLNPSDGGHATIHPDDISIAMNSRVEVGRTSPSFVVFATGGFVAPGFAVQGSENFVVCPPEHIESTGPAFICHTKLRKVRFEWLEDYVQAELMKLKHFPKFTPNAKGNLWFGMSSKKDGTATHSFLQAESKFLNQTSLVNQYKELLKDVPKVQKTKSTSEGKEQIVFNVGD